MRDFLKKNFFPSAPQNQDLLDLKSEVQRLRLALDEADAARRRLEDELARQRNSDEARRSAAVEKVLRDFSAPAAQFLLQIDLVERQGKTIQTSGTLAVARSLLKALANHGLEAAETAGETQPFDPERHIPQAGGEAPQPGQPVVIRTPGFTFQGRRVHKAGVSVREQ